jgi:VanZ family protein
VRLVNPRRRPSSAGRWLLFILPALGSLFFLIEPLDLPRAIRPLLDLSHVPIFALASGLLVRWFAPLARLGVRLQLTVLLLLAFVVGGGIELLQPLFGRNASLDDAVYDLAGAATGVLFCSRRRRDFSWHWRRGLQIVILAVLLLASQRAVGWYIAASDAAARFPLLADFETPFAERLWSHGERTDAISRNGLHSLHVSFPVHGWPAVTLEPTRPDWSGFRELRLSVFNPRPLAQDLGILVADRELPDRLGNRRPWFRQRVSLEPGWNDLAVPLAQVAMGGAEGPVDIAQVGFLTLEVPPAEGAVDLYLDDLHLVPSAAGGTGTGPAEAR